MAVSDWDADAIESFAERFRETMNEKYKSAVQFSQKSGITLSTVHGWLCNYQYPSMEYLPVLVEYLDISANELLWNGMEWIEVRKRIKKIKGNSPEYVTTISKWEGRPFSELLTNAIIYEHGSIKEFSKLIGIGKETLERYASGKNIPKTKYFKKICEWFDLSADDALATIELEVQQRESVQ